MQVYSNELCHYGVIGMKWGVRRYQNADGSLTSRGQKRYNSANKRMESNLNYSKKYAEKIASARAKNREKISNKYDKKITKLENKLSISAPSAINDKNVYKLKQLKSTKSYKLKDFDKGTKYVNAGLKQHQDTIKKYYTSKMSVIKGEMDKKGPEYKAAMKAYVDQVLTDSYYGNPAGSVLNYAHNAAINDVTKKK